jgi:hypothetical protein
LAAGLILALIISGYRAHDRWAHSIRRVGSTGGFGGFNATFDTYQLTYYQDQRGRPVAYAIFLYDPYDPNIPATARHYRYDSWQGGILKVDGDRVDPMAGPALFVNGAYGYTAQFDLNEADVSTLEAIVANSKRHDLLFQFWRDHVEPRLFKIKGTTAAGQRDGPWNYRLQDGSLYLEANYQKGERHGDWTTYYPGGSVQCRRHFDAGRPSGQWDYYDEHGLHLGSLEWEGGFLKTKGREVQSGGSGGDARVVTLPSGKRTGFVLSERDGGTFWIEGQSMQRPKLNALLLTEVRDSP